jgi:hypothetical protein
MQVYIMIDLVEQTQLPENEAQTSTCLSLTLLKEALTAIVIRKKIGN